LDIENVTQIAVISGRPEMETEWRTVAAVQSFVDDGLFLDPATGSNTSIVAKLMRLAEEADEATRQL
jgi:hypothetical protein